MSDLKAYVETGFTPEYRNKNFTNYFGEEYFKEYNGRLYKNNRVGGVGNERSYHFDTLRILSYNENTLEIQVDVYLWDEKEAVQTIKMVKKDDHWRLDNADPDFY